MWFGCRWYGFLDSIFFHSSCVEQSTSSSIQAYAHKGIKIFLLKKRDIWLGIYQNPFLDFHKLRCGSSTTDSYQVSNGWCNGWWKSRKYSIQNVTPNYPIPYMEGKCKPHSFYYDFQLNGYHHVEDVLFFKIVF